jgi:hypothetical protein
LWQNSKTGWKCDVITDCLLAEKIGYEYSEIKWLETQQSPTETILEKWISDGKCLSDLKTYLFEMGRLDVVSLFDDAISTSGSKV